MPGVVATAQPLMNQLAEFARQLGDFAAANAQPAAELAGRVMQARAAGLVLMFWLGLSVPLIALAIALVCLVVAIRDDSGGAGFAAFIAGFVGVVSGAIVLCEGVARYGVWSAAAADWRVALAAKFMGLLT